MPELTMHLTDADLQQLQRVAQEHDMSLEEAAAHAVGLGVEADMREGQQSGPQLPH